MVIPESIVEDSHCGSFAAGWINGTHPTVEGQQVNAEVCFTQDHGNGIYWHQDILITHCGEYFVYYLPEAPHCYSRYCAAEQF